MHSWQLFSLPVEAFSANRRRRSYSYTPQSPTISPWMGLWRQNTGALDNYHTFVRPQMQLNQTLQMQNAALSRQAMGLQALNNEINQPLENQSGMLATGQGATFMNYSHYYYSGNRQAANSVGGRPTPRSAISRAAAPSASMIHNVSAPTAGMPH